MFTLLSVFLHPTSLPRATIELGHLCWVGGENVQEVIGEYEEGAVFESWVRVLKSDGASVELRKAILRSASVACRLHRDNQSALAHAGMVQCVCDALQASEEDTRRWAASCLFTLLGNHAHCQSLALRRKNLQSVLAAVARDDWTRWPRNDALNTSKLLGFVPI